MKKIALSFILIILSLLLFSFASAEPTVRDVGILNGEEDPASEVYPHLPSENPECGRQRGGTETGAER